MYFTCFMAVTVITKKRGRPLVTGEVGVSIINWKDKHRDGSGEISTKNDNQALVRVSVSYQRENKRTQKTTKRTDSCSVKQEMHTTSFKGNGQSELHTPYEKLKTSKEI